MNKAVITSSAAANTIIDRLAAILPTGKTIGAYDDKLLINVASDSVELQVITDDISVNVDITPYVTLNVTTDDTASDGSYAVNGRDLAKAVSVLHQDTVLTLTDDTQNDQHVVTLRITDAAKHRLTLRCLPVSVNSVDDVKVNSTSQVANLPLAVLPAVDKMARAANTDKQGTNDMLKNIKLVLAKDSGLTAWATDAHSLVKYQQTDIDYTADTNVACLVSGDGWHKATSLLTKLDADSADDDVQLIANDRVVALTTASATVVLSHYGDFASFPDVDKVITTADDDACSVQVDANTLVDALTRCQLVNSKDGVAIAIGNDSQLHLAVNSDVDAYQETIAGMHAATTDPAAPAVLATLHVNVAGFKALVKVMDDSLITLKVARNLAPVYLHAQVADGCVVSAAIAQIVTA